MANTENPASVLRRRSLLLRVLLAAGCAGVILVFVLFFGVGRWLVVEDPLEKARAIAVLSGRMPLRAIEAAKLYRQGYAPEVWLTHSSEPGESLKRMGISFDDSFDPKHWWRTTNDALDVLREVLGLVNAWAGLPLHASQ